MDASRPEGGGNFLSALRVFSWMALRQSLAWMLALLFVGSLTAVLFGRFFFAVGGEGDTALKYDVSLVCADNPFFVAILKSELQKIPLIDKVFLLSREEAAAKIAANETILSLEFPPSFLSDAMSGSEEGAVLVSLNPSMPAESERVADLTESLGRSLSEMLSTNFAWQKLYVSITGDEDESWNKTTAFAFQGLDLFGKRGEGLSREELNPYEGVAWYLSSILLLFSLLPALIVLERRGRQLRTSFQERLDLSGFSLLQGVVQLLTGLLLFILLALPVYLLARPLLSGNDRDLVFSFLSLSLASLSASTFFAFLATLPLNASFRSAIGWLLILLALLLAGALVPLEFFPPFLRKMASVSPLAAVFHENLLLLSHGGASGGRVLSAGFWPMIPAFFLYFVGERRRVKR